MTNAFTIDDVTEAHFGAEWTLLTGPRSVFVRAGAFTNPFQGIRFAGSSDPRENAVYHAMFNIGSRSTDVIGTFGAGVGAGRLQLDVAYVWNRDLVVSAAVGL